MHHQSNQEIKILSPTAILGYGFPIESLEAGLAQKPDAIAVDAGSTDAGPYYLGLSVEEAMSQKGSFSQFVKRDLEPLLVSAVQNRIPLLIGSAGFAGGQIHLMGLIGLIHLIAEEHKLNFKLATINAEIEKSDVHEKLQAQQITSLVPNRQLTKEHIEDSTRIVGQMGVAPFVRALELGADVVIAGRANDPSMFAALPILKGFDMAQSIFMGKILECGAIAAEPGSGSDALLATLRKDSFSVEPLNPNRACTIQSIAAHALYEKENPNILVGPEGQIDLSQVKYTQESERRVRVSGATMAASPSCTIKIEGARRVGYRAIAISAIRDRAMIRALDDSLQTAKSSFEKHFKVHRHPHFQVAFHVFGKEPGATFMNREQAPLPGEVCLLMECLGKTQADATSACAWLRSHLLHMGFEGRFSTAGNMAFPFSPADIPTGPVFEFNIFDVMHDVDQNSLFPVQMSTVEY